MASIGSGSRRNSDPHRHHQRRLRGDRRRALPMRTPGESYSDVILRLVAESG
jgi:hypothetical protein